ncbi:unnamed protein product [Pylaiella littoralis]
MTNTTTTTRSINVKFQGASRDVVLPNSVTLAGLQAAIASTFKVDLPARSGADDEPKHSDLSFTYKDPEGDDIVFDKDSELKLALRLSPSSLKISAACKTKPTDKPDPELELYQIAARNLREYHGVPSMTPAKLTKTLVFLKLKPRRLVKQGLAPDALLARADAETKNKLPLGDDDNNEDLVESVAADVEMMNVDEDDKKEWNDGFVSVESAATPAAAAPLLRPPLKRALRRRTSSTRPSSRVASSSAPARSNLCSSPWAYGLAAWSGSGTLTVGASAPCSKRRRGPTSATDTSAWPVVVVPVPRALGAIGVPAVG